MEKSLFRPRRTRIAALTLIFFVLALLWLGAGSLLVSRSVNAQELTHLTRTIRRYAVQCYALEGRYPPTLEYLVARYGLTLDRSRYVYHYRALGANLMPQIAVFALTPVD
jgi:hypothetical protein